MASFTKRGNTWQYTVSRMVDGKYKPIRKGGFRTKKEAEVAAADVEDRLRKGLGPSLTPKPFDEYFEDWVEVYKAHVAKNTKKRYLNTFKTIKEYFGNTSIQDITKRDYQIFLNDYGKTRAKSTSDKLNSHIRACIKDAIDEGLIRVDFTRNIITTGREEKRSEDKHISYKESKKLLNEINKRLDTSLNYYLLLLALTTGMRFGEIVGLTRKDFNFTDNTISINKVWGYTNKMHEGFGPTKNEQSVRTIKVDEHTMDKFNQLFKKTPKNMHDLVFYSSASKYKVISNAASNKLLKNTLKRLKIKGISIHGLRHTHASVLLYKRVSIYYVSERLGHKDIETTMNEYAHVIKELRTEDENATTKVFGYMINKKKMKNKENKPEKPRV